jgi:hypothetical protein
LVQNEIVSLALPLFRAQLLAALVPESIKRQGPEALIEAFRKHGVCPDGLGDLHNLSHPVARALRACGYKARAGCYGGVWRCPPLPDELVRWTEFYHLSDALPRAYGYRLGEWNPKRAQFRPVFPKDPLSKHQHRLIRMIRGAANRRLTRRQLQTRVSRWANAWYLDHMLNILESLGRIKVQDGWISL